MAVEGSVPSVEGGVPYGTHKKRRDCRISEENKMKTSRLPMAVSTALVLLFFATAASATLIGRSRYHFRGGWRDGFGDEYRLVPTRWSPGWSICGGWRYRLLTYGPGSNGWLRLGSTGRLLDLTLGVTVLPLAGFMTFDSLPISLDLAQHRPWTGQYQLRRAGRWRQLLPVCGLAVLPDAGPGFPWKSEHCSGPPRGGHCNG